MTDGRISVRERMRALERLDRLAWELNQAGAWLAECGSETEGDMIEQAARSVLSACWLLSRPVRGEPGPERWQVAVSGTDVNGRPYGR